MGDYVQTTYLSQKEQGWLDGQLIDQNPKTIYPMKVETAAIEFGRIVSQGTENDQCELAGAARLGLAVRSLQYEGNSYAVGNVAPIITKGNVAAKVVGTGLKGAALTFTSDGVLNTAAADGTHITANAKLLEDVTVSGTVAAVELL